MRLKQIKLAGFKSFVDPTTVPLPGAMTAVVGPNGCGKSNIIDAVRWVLGESSAKNLRGEAMTDVIFNGSSARKPISQASVELVFDNSEGRLGGAWANFAEISVRRLVNRDSENSYFLNGSRCRRKDITELFLGTGLGPRSYAIIEQGMISRLIESRPQELRIFIEEAAGISKYKEKRRESETRLRHTSENMERLSDIREELGQQLEKLKRQSAAARRYRELKIRERQLKAELAVIRYLDIGEQMNRLDGEIRQRETAFAAADADLQRDETADLALLERYSLAEQQQRQLQTQLVTVATAVSRLEQQLLMEREQRRRRQQDAQQLAYSLEQADFEIASGDEQLVELVAQAEEVDEALARAEAQVAVASEQLELAADADLEGQQQWRQLNQQVTAWQRQQDDAAARQRHLNHQIGEQQRRIASLNQQAGVEIDDQALAITNERLVMALAVESDSEALVDQLTASMANAVAVQRDRELTLAAVREQWADIKGQRQLLCQQLAQLTSNQDGADEGSERLPQWFADAVIDPHWAVAAEPLLAPFALTPVADEGQFPHIDRQTHGVAVSGTLATVVSSPRGLLSWLNSVHLAVDLADALSRRDQLPAGHSLLTADGQWLGAGWWLQLQRQGVTPLQWQQQLLGLEEGLAALEQQRAQLAGERDQQQTVVERLRGELAQAQSQLVANRHQSAAARQQLALAEQAAAAAEQALQRQQQQLVQEQARLAELEPELAVAEEQRFRAEEALAELLPQLQAAEQAQHSHHGRRQQLLGQLQQAQQQLQQQASHKASLHARLHGQQEALRRSRQQRDELQRRLAQLRDELALEPDHQLQDEELQALLEERLMVEQQLADAGSELAAMSDERKAVQERRRQVGQRRDQIRSETDRLRLEREGLSSRAAVLLEQLTEMQVELKSMVDSLDPAANETVWASELEQVSAAISRLGPINLAAIEEYDTQAERKGYLDAQYEDLRQAVETLENAIRRIDRETRQRFRDTFEQVNSGLQALFPKVFGGGSAYLELTDDDLLETGVTIMARPPGKKNSTIHLLSGGEKALTALSLVFAIFQLNPAPFCMLDEVDAPLDDANVGRFCNLVREMSESVQFVFISHNKVSMEMATHLTGVTMHEPGVSRMVAVDIEQALSYAQTA